ncbi:MAG: OmpA family protein, partial [Bacteroidota bacterium]
FRIFRNIIILILVAILGVWGYRQLNNSGLIGEKPQESQYVEATTAEFTVLNTAPPNYASTTPARELPSSEKTSIGGPVWNAMGIPWQGANPFHFANGGVETTKGSLFEEAGVKVKTTRLDDYGDHYKQFGTFVNAYKDDPKTTDGAQFVWYMGDASPYYLYSLNEICQKVDPSYHPVVFTISGGSFGEDGYFGPPEWLDNPELAKGSLCAAYPMDGDQNIVLIWAAYNQIKVNVDQNTYDPDAINFYDVGDFIKATDAFITETPVKRKEIKNGQLTGNTVDKIVDSYATWTPGDVRLIEKYTGKKPVARIYSTKENMNQMLTTFVGLNKHLEDNRGKIVRMVTAISDASDQMKTYDEALRHSCEIASKVYASEREQIHDGEWWYKYYMGVDTFFNGTLLKLGGSRALNLSEAGEAMGVIGKGYYKNEIYPFFGEKYKVLYPDELDQYPNADVVFDGRYLSEAMRLKENSGKLTEATEVTYSEGESKRTIASAAYNITFNTNSSQITPQGLEVLQEVYRVLTATQGTRISIEGHTDSRGADGANQSLSEQRAQSVQTWFMSNDVAQFPSERFANVVGKGESEPVMKNGKEDQAASRRVVIKVVE